MDNPPVSETSCDEGLAAQAQAGLRAPFEELVRRYSHRLYHFLRPKIGTDQDTEDLVQETFLKVFRNIHRFDNTYKFSTWLYTTAARLAIGFYRKNRMGVLMSVPAATFLDPQEAMLRQEDSRNLWDLARKELKPDQFQALWLRTMEEMSLKEITAVLKKSPVHVRVLLHRARLQLSKRLNPAASTEETKKTAPGIFHFSNKENTA